MTTQYAEPSRRLQNLAAFGRKADVALLARLGPACALYVDTDKLRTDPGQTVLDEASSFAFARDHLAETDAAYSLRAVGAAYARHFTRALTVTVDPLLYLFAAALEADLDELCENIVRHWSATADGAIAMTATLSERFAASKFAAFAIAPANTDSLLTLAEFFMHRTNSPNLVVLFTASSIFATNTRVPAVDCALRKIGDKMRERAHDVNCAQTVRVPLCMLDASTSDDAMVPMTVSDKARQFIATTRERAHLSLADIIAPKADELNELDALARATKRGELCFGDAEALRHFKLLNNRVAIDV